ncbi:MAG: hypothetical protein P9X22_05140, partial [Candidatus Zapsychrus exili]|nr:hypothetical protein [Candidatus Zapsychrus exili]
MTSKELDVLSPNYKAGVVEAMKEGRWDEIIEAYRQLISFGTAGVRGKAVFTKEELLKLKEEGIGAKILKGPNMINDIVIFLETMAVIKYAKENGLKKVLIGYDSRIAGAEFADMVARLFIGQSEASHEFKIFLFDEASPFPELSYGITTDLVKADIGILMSASHNPNIYNGYKITLENGAQLNQEVKDAVSAKVPNVEFSEIKLAKSITEAKPGNLVWLGGNEKLSNKEYYDFPLEDMHTLHVNQVKKFLVDETLIEEWGNKIQIGYSAYNGAGFKAVPRLLKEIGFTNYKAITALQKLDGLFPAFGWGEQPDPGDPLAGKAAVREFIEEYGQDAFDALDILLGTDPDADRTGIEVKVPVNQQKYFGKSRLLSANDAWTLLLWYQLKRGSELGKVDLNKTKVAISHVTTDAIAEIAKTFGVDALGRMKDKTGKVDRGNYLTNSRTWVGFTYLAEIMEEAMKDGIRVYSFEESNGFSVTGHTFEKDGTLASVLLAEVAAYAESQGTTMFELLDGIYRQIGHYATANKALPRIGSFEGAAGVSDKIQIIEKTEEWLKRANGEGDSLVIAGRKVIGAVDFRSGRADHLIYENAPDEGIRFFFEDSNLTEESDFRDSKNYITIRPSGTSQTLRFYVQLVESVSDIKGEVLARIKADNYYAAEKVGLLAQKQILEATELSQHLPSVIEQIEALEKDNPADQAMLSQKHLGAINNLYHNILPNDALGIHAYYKTKKAIVVNRYNTNDVSEARFKMHPVSIHINGGKLEDYPEQVKEFWLLNDVLYMIEKDFSGVDIQYSRREVDGVEVYRTSIVYKKNSKNTEENLKKLKEELGLWLMFRQGELREQRGILEEFKGKGFSVSKFSGRFGEVSKALGILRSGLSMWKEPVNDIKQANVPFSFVGGEPIREKYDGLSKAELEMNYFHILEKSKFWNIMNILKNMERDFGDIKIIYNVREIPFGTQRNSTSNNSFEVTEVGVRIFGIAKNSKKALEKLEDRMKRWAVDRLGENVERDEQIASEVVKSFANKNVTDEGRDMIKLYLLNPEHELNSIKIIGELAKSLKTIDRVEALSEAEAILHFAKQAFDQKKKQQIVQVDKAMLILDEAEKIAVTSAKEALGLKDARVVDWRKSEAILTYI